MYEPVPLVGELIAKKSLVARLDAPMEQLPAASPVNQNCTSPEMVTVCCWMEQKSRPERMLYSTAPVPDPPEVNRRILSPKFTLVGEEIISGCCAAGTTVTSRVEETGR